MKNEGLVIDSFSRYVDDCRVILPSINKGLPWSNGRFEFSEKKLSEDNIGEKTDQQRTATEISKSMCSLTKYLKFTMEESGMFSFGMLPTLDVRIWESNGKILYSFFEIPTVGNRVILKSSAVPELFKESTLVQENIRRLQNCSEAVGMEVKSEILSSCAQKFVNSGYSSTETRVMIVQGVTKFLEIVRMSKLRKDDRNYTPLHLSNEYLEGERQIKKYMSKMNWYENNGPDKVKVEWRGKLRGIWRGKQPIQRGVKNMKFSTVIQVPSSKDSVLIKALARQEPTLARSTGYNIKIIEKYGVQLSRLLDRVFRPLKCHSLKCLVCKFMAEGKGSKCRITNVVCKAECIVCEQQNHGTTEDNPTANTYCKTKTVKKKGLYIGETSRSLFERSSEHMAGILKANESNFIVKHWANEPSQSDSPPIMRFSVIQTHIDAMSRLIQEAVLIASMNSKAEWRKNPKPRLVLEEPDWIRKKSEAEKSKQELEETLRVKCVIAKIDKLNDELKTPKIESNDSSLGIKTRTMTGIIEYTKRKVGVNTELPSSLGNEKRLKKSYKDKGVVVNESIKTCNNVIDECIVLNEGIKTEVVNRPSSGAIHECGERCIKTGAVYAQCSTCHSKNRKFVEPVEIFE